MSYDRLIRAAGGADQWALSDGVFDAMAKEYDARLAALLPKLEAFTPEAISTLAAASRSTPQSSGAVAVVPVRGLITQRAGLMTLLFGGTSTEWLAADLRDMAANPQVAAIVLDMDSPGGSVFGVDELASEIRELRRQKPIVAVANSVMGSAAYWIGSAASEIVVPPTGQVGSIGVFAAHVDRSIANEQAGIKVTLIKAGKYKAEGDPNSPLSAEAQTYAQSMVDTYYDAFIGAVADGRGVSRDAIRNGYGQGREVIGRTAERAGLADRTQTLEQTINRLQSPQERSAVMRQSAEGTREIVAIEDLPESLTPTKRETERALRDVGYSQAEAKAFIARAWESDARDVPEEATQTGNALDLLAAELDLLVATL